MTHGLAPGAVPVVTSQATVVVASGRSTIDAMPDSTRVVVGIGGARVTSSSGQIQQLSTGEVLLSNGEGRVTVSRPARIAPAPATAIVTEPSRDVAQTVLTPEQRWSAAMRALDVGDRAAAEAELLQLLREIDHASPLEPRASFVVAEIELTRGSVVTARPRLQAIMHGPDEQLSEDAATLLARSYPTAGEHAVVWKDYLDTSPPPPRRGRALRELCSEAPSSAACTTPAKPVSP
jgi:hypothetical protein